MRADIKRYVAACMICETTKYSTQPPAGLLQPLAISLQVWDDISMDFIVGLPLSRGSTVILVVVDRLSKYIHLGALPTDFDAHRVAFLFIDIVIKLHGFPKSIVSDRDKVFLSKFWQETLKLSGTSLHLSTAFHPQSDGQTEVANRGVEQYLRAFTQEKPTRWTVLLPWAEYALNTSHHSGLQMTPFQALYGREPPSFLPYSTGDCTLPLVDELLTERTELIRCLRANLELAQHRMRTQADRHRRDVQFKVGDLVLLKLQPYRQHSVVARRSQKLARRYYGPFEVLDKVGAVAYRLKLPETSRVHPVFHVSLLKPFNASSTPQPALKLPAEFVNGSPLSHPLRIHGRRNVLVGGNMVDQALIEWSDGDLDDATWEPVDSIRRHFPDLHLEDKVARDRGGNVTHEVTTTKELEIEQTEEEARGANDLDNLGFADVDQDDNNIMGLAQNEDQPSHHGPRHETRRSIRVRKPPSWQSSYKI